MTTWYTSDWHFSHRNILHFGSGRPFDTIEEHDAELVRRHNVVVAPSDTVVVLGDVAMGCIEESLALCAQMNGHKILICGNHDRPAMARMPDKALSWIHRYREEGGFDDVWLEATDRVELGGQSVLPISTAEPLSLHRRQPGNRSFRRPQTCRPREMAAARPRA